jgi:polysaccharide export outer membrane protein
MSGRQNAGVLIALALVLAAVPPAGTQEYIVGPGDVLEISFLGEPQLSGLYPVRPDGKITLPMLGEVEVAGQSSRQVADRLAQALRRFLRDPQVTVAVRQSSLRRQFVYVLGQVVRPGAYEYLGGWTLAELLATAGGPTAKAALRRAVILRRNVAIPVDLEQLLVKGNPEANVRLEPGDVVIVSEIDERVHVLGEVARPGYHELRDGDRILDIITKAGGVTIKAAPERISILRDEGPLTVDLISFLQKGRVDQNVPMRNGDIVFVPETENRVVVLGQVVKPGPYFFKAGDRVTDLLSAAGGPTPRASLREVGVIRQNGDKPTVLVANLDRFFRAGDTSQNVALKPGDVVFVPDRPGVTWAEVLEMVRQMTFLYLLFR